MAIKMTEREARAFYAQIGRPYPGDPDPRAGRVGLAAVAAALKDTWELPQSPMYIRRIRARAWGIRAVVAALEGGL